MASVSNTMEKEGPSKCLEHKKIVTSASTQNKQDITNAMEVCRQTLKKRNIINDKPDTEMTIQHTVLGGRFAELIINMLKAHDNDTAKAGECSSEDDDLSIEEMSSTAKHSSPKKVTKNSIVPLNIERKVIQRREQEPLFDLRLLSKKRSGGSQKKGGIKKWKRHQQN